MNWEDHSFNNNNKYVLVLQTFNHAVSVYIYEHDLKSSINFVQFLRAYF